MVKKFLFVGCIIFIISLVSCNSDDDNAKTLSPEEQNTADDAAIINFLNSYYFDDLGKISKFSDAITPADKVPLRVNAVKDPSGFWVVKNPKASSGSGNIPDGKNNILIHYSLKYFTATEGGNGYTTLSTASSTIDNSGVAQENPFFYKKPKNDSIHSENYYVMKGIVNGLNHFKPTNKGENDPYTILQGAILVPSRLAYAGEQNYLNLKNTVFILNFELYKVCPEDQLCK